MTLKQSSAVHIQALVSADGILPGSSSKLRLLVINLASVPGGQLVNSPTAQSLERWHKILTALISILTIIILLALVRQATDKTIQSDNKFDTLALPLDSATFYFKTKTNWQDTTQNALDSFVNQWYSKTLFKMEEPVLSSYKGDKEIYRFTWLRTFHHPVAVRLEKQDIF